ncbi:hypothetical protein G6F43_009023 [Rhizopus delemar]|nr:hypothetical protein G6F43_009023 [Rhizopus delemar]
MPSSQNHLKRRYFVGSLALSAVIFIWVASSFVMNNMFSDLKYNKPFMITYINTTTFSLYMLPYICSFRKYKIESLNENGASETEVRLLGNDNTVDDTEEEPETIQSALDIVETIKLSLTFCFLWFLANYTTNASLAYTSVTSSTILSSMSGLCTLFLGSLLRVEPFSWTKVIAVFTSFTGVILVSYSDNSNIDGLLSPSSPLIGDILALCGALFYGCYTNLLKLKIGDESRINMPLFFGFVGVFNMLFMWPFFFVLNYFELEKFELPFSSSILIMILLNAFIGTFLSDYLWLLAMLMTSPLVVTLGVSLTIPLAIAGDAVFKHFVPELEYAFGALLVITGFFVVNIATLSNIKERESLRSRDYESLINDPEENEAGAVQALNDINTYRKQGSSSGNNLYK